MTSLSDILGRAKPPDEPSNQYEIPNQYGVRRKPADPTEAQLLKRVEGALAKNPVPIPNSSDAVVTAFLEMGENIARSMEAMGDKALEQGEARKAEYYRAAQTARDKAAYQAREAGELIDDFITMKSMAGDRRPRAVAETPPNPPEQKP